MISDTVLEKIMGHLTEAGFSPARDYTCGLGEGRVGTDVPYPAFVRVKQTELDALTAVGDSEECLALVTVQIRALGAEAGFYDAERLISMTESAAARIFFSSDIIVRRIVCGEPKRNMPLGRLEQVIELTAAVRTGRGSFE